MAATTKKKRTAKGRSTPRRAVIVAGSRTPFVRAFKEFMRLDAIDLGVAAVRALLSRSELRYQDVDAVVWGGVILPSASPNVGREINYMRRALHDFPPWLQFPRLGNSFSRFPGFPRFRVSAFGVSHFGN